MRMEEGYFSRWAAMPPRKGRHIKFGSDANGDGIRIHPPKEQYTEHCHVTTELCRPTRCRVGGYVWRQDHIWFCTRARPSLNIWVLYCRNAKLFLLVTEANTCPGFQIFGSPISSLIFLFAGSRRKNSKSNKRLLKPNSIPGSAKYNNICQSKEESRQWPNG